MRIPTASALALVIVLGACAPAENDAATEPSPGLDSTTTSSTVPDATTTTIAGTPPAEVVETALDDLATRLDADPRRIRLISSELVTWPDASLGCPSPGQSYTQAQVDGYQVVLTHEGRAFDYHGETGGEPFLCPTDEKDGGYEIVPPPGFDD